MTFLNVLCAPQVRILAVPRVYGESLQLFWEEHGQVTLSKFSNVSLTLFTDCELLLILWRVMFCRNVLMLYLKTQFRELLSRLSGMLLPWPPFVLHVRFQISWCTLCGKSRAKVCERSLNASKA